MRDEKPYRTLVDELKRSTANASIYREVVQENERLRTFLQELIVKLGVSNRAVELLRQEVADLRAEVTQLAGLARLQRDEEIK